MHDLTEISLTHDIRISDPVFRTPADPTRIELEDICFER